MREQLHSRGRAEERQPAARTGGLLARRSRCSRRHAANRAGPPLPPPLRPGSPHQFLHLSVAVGLAGDEGVGPSDGRHLGALCLRLGGAPRSSCPSVCVQGRRRADLGSVWGVALERDRESVSLCVQRNAVGTLRRWRSESGAKCCVACLQHCACVPPSLGRVAVRSPPSPQQQQRQQAELRRQGCPTRTPGDKPGCHQRQCPSPLRRRPLPAAALCLPLRRQAILKEKPTERLGLSEEEEVAVRLSTGRRRRQ